jgi:PAS domain S-box-containing protein
MSLQWIAGIAAAVRGGATRSRPGELGHENPAREVPDRALRQGEEHFRSLCESFPAGIIETDRSGQCRYANARWQEISGLSTEQSLGHGWMESVHPEDRARVGELWNAAVSTGEGFEHEFRVPSAGRSPRWVAARAAALRSEGGITGMVVTVADITLFKQAELELVRAREAALETARLKSEFLASMSHEIRTPLNGVVGMTDLALETDLTREQREYLEIVKTSADGLLTIIDDILDFSKIEAGRLELDPIACDLRECVNECLKTLALRADRKGIELIGDIRPEVPEAVMADAVRLRQILLNLIGNAVKFTDQGEVVVRIDREAADGETMTLHFVVSDTGIGIPLEKQATIFDAFTQADMSTTRQYGGTGLGLAISARLVHMMGGRIWVESEPDRGSRFHFTIATHAATIERPATEGDPARIDLNGVPALVVDDNATNRRVLEETLLHWGMQPAMAESGTAALELMERAREEDRHYRLVVLDCNMPEMDGFEVARRIREHPALAGVTLMMLSSSTHVGDAARCRELKLGGYLLKPVGTNDLADAIRHALARQSRPRVEPRSMAPPGAAPAVSPGLRVLVAEDNPVNQRVVVGMLERQNHKVVLVENGAKAVERLKSERFDVVLMDVQMPVMGGFEAAAAIRASEQESGGHVPIIGVTAHAMSGDRERCLGAGMDGYLSKPFKATALYAALKEVLSRTAPAAPPEPRPGEEPLIDTAAALENACGDPMLLSEIARLCLAAAPSGMEELMAAHQGGDSAGVARAAHRLRGSLGTLGALRAAAAAARVEELATEGMEPAIAAAISDLAGEIEHATPLIEGMILPEAA